MCRLARPPSLVAAGTYPCAVAGLYISRGKGLGDG